MRVFGCVKPGMRNESEGALVALEVGSAPTRRAAPSTDRSLAKDSSKSISVGTRKMVNYA